MLNVNTIDGIFGGDNKSSPVAMPLVPPYIESLQPYQPGKSASELRREYGLKDVTKLASNENPLGPSPLAIAELERHHSDLHLYPDGGRALRQDLAEKFCVKLDNVIAGSGSEGIMSNIVRTFLGDEDEVLTSEGTFVGFYVLARSRGVKLVMVPLKEFRYDLRGIAAHITERTKIIYLANPNNPTGTIFTVSEFEEFMRQVPQHVLIILDEAYFEYATGNPHYPDSMLYRYDNVITLRTFSKIYGLAGVRIGYGFAHDLLIRNLLKVKLPFEPSTLAQVAGMAALKDSEYLKESLLVNAAGKQFLSSALQELGLKVVETNANFFMVPFPDERQVDEVYGGLLRHGVIIRPLKGFGLPHSVRITIGTGSQNKKLMEALRKVLAANRSE
jgi:histidinol-phosphate aminotransferase